MTSNRRSASLSLGLSLLLVAGVASAAPVAVKRESAIVSLGKAIKVGAQEYKERRVAAGPGLIKRAMVRTGALMRTAGGAVGGMAISVKDSAVTLGQRTKEGAIATKQAVVAAPAASKSMVVGAWQRTKDRTVAVKDAVKAGVNRMVLGTKSAVAQIMERRAAQKDFNVWLKEEGHRDLKTFHAGAMKESGLGMAKTMRAANAAMTAAGGAVAATGQPLGLVGVGLSGTATMLAQAQVRDAKQTAATRTLEFALNSKDVRIDNARVARWIKAGILTDPTEPTVP